MAVGGGVTLDVAGFVASIFRRGVSFVRIPTSLIGLVDVAVGIKQGINVDNKKSIVGTFYPATLNINDPTFLATLPQRHVSCGMAEIIKMAVVRDAKLFAILENVASQLIASKFQCPAAGRDIILRAERLMMQELQPNLFESELRRLADFGHTFSPAIESASGWSINHGEAVGLDMLISTAIAREKGLCSNETLFRLHNLLRISKLPVIHPVCERQLLVNAISSAKSHRGGRVNLVVPREIGKAEFVDHVRAKEIEMALRHLRAEKTHNVCSPRGSGRDTSAARVVARS
jgi:3-dehydroquinate synthase